MRLIGPIGLIRLMALIGILPFASRARTIIYRPLRTVVVAGEAGYATAIVLPLWIAFAATDDILRGADLGTDATLNAAFPINAERAVGEEKSLEKSAQ